MKNLSKDMIINHMNSEHMDSIINISNKYAQNQKFETVKMVDIDSTGMYFLFDGEKTIKINFPHEVSGEDLPKMIITMSKESGETKDNYEVILKELNDYLDSFKSLTLGTLSPEGKVNVTYAPCVKFQDNFYIFISEVADHYDNLKANPDNFEVLFLEDEKIAASPIVRKRARFYSTCEFLERNNEFNIIMDIFEEKIGGAIKAIRNMEDFHLVKLNFLDGRFVKGFGQAYTIKGNKVTHMTGEKKGHRWNTK